MSIGKFSHLITGRTAKFDLVAPKPMVGLDDAKPKARGRQPQQPGNMNKLEARYASELELRKRAGEIADWWFETLKLQLAPRTWYTPDFVILHCDGLIECVETKGFLRDDASVKFKVARAKYYFMQFTMLTWKERAWKEMLAEKLAAGEPLHALEADLEARDQT